MKKAEQTNMDRNEEKKRALGLVVSLVTFIIVVCIFLYLSLGWFNNNTINKADGMNVGIIGTLDSSFDIYEANYVTTDTATTEYWVKISALDISTMVANETRRYLIVSPEGFEKFTMKINSMNAHSATVDPNEVEKYFYINQVTGYTFDKITKDTQNNTIYTNTTFAPLLNTDNYTYTQLKNLSFDKVIDSNNIIEYSQDKNRVFVFDVYTDEDVCNCFSDWSLEGNVTIR